MQKPFGLLLKVESFEEQPSIHPLEQPNGEIYLCRSLKDLSLSLIDTLLTNESEPYHDRILI